LSGNFIFVCQKTCSHVVPDLPNKFAKFLIILRNSESPATGKEI